MLQAGIIKLCRKNRNVNAAPEPAVQTVAESSTEKSSQSLNISTNVKANEKNIVSSESEKVEKPVQGNTCSAAWNKLIQNPLFNQDDNTKRALVEIIAISGLFENDSNVEWMASELGAEVVDYEYSSLHGVILTRTGGLLVPGFVRGEGQFVSILRKTAPAGATKNGVEVLRPIRNGLEKGVTKGRDFIPSADWALSIDPPLDKYPAVELDLDTALRFLHRDGIFVEGQPDGFLMVCFEGHPLGFVKNIGKRWNNLHPQNRRIRIDL